jgi:hypothetical protein
MVNREVRAGPGGRCCLVFAAILKSLGTPRLVLLPAFAVLEERVRGGQVMHRTVWVSRL